MQAGHVKSKLAAQAGKSASSPHGRFQLGCQMIRSQSAELTEAVELMMPAQFQTFGNKISITVANSPARRNVPRSEASRGIAVCFTLKMNGRAWHFKSV
jgi:hypothetical protein